MRFSIPGIGHWELSSFPGQGQIVVSSHAFVEKNIRRRGHGTSLAKARITDAKNLGYDYMLATVLLENEAQIKIMKKLEWKYLDQFVDRRTEKTVLIFGRNIP